MAFNVFYGKDIKHDFRSKLDFFYLTQHGRVATNQSRAMPKHHGPLDDGAADCIRVTPATTPRLHKNDTETAPAGLRSSIKKRQTPEEDLSYTVALTALVQ